MSSLTRNERGAPSGRSPRSRTLGLTGPAGGGKSFLLGLFAQEGAAVVEADRVYQGLVAAGAPLLGSLAERFGGGVIAADGGLDREALGRMVFADPRALADLNALTHPALGAAVAERLRAAGARPVVIEAAVLFEIAADRLCDAVWFVEATREVRIARLMASRGWTEERAAGVVSAQGAMDAVRARCDREVDGAAPEDALRALAAEWLSS